MDITNKELRDALNQLEDKGLIKTIETQVFDDCECCVCGKYLCMRVISPKKKEMTDVLCCRECAEAEVRFMNCEDD